ncbi:MAG: FAD-dependent oxidoreductase [Planctomycetota bacterium]
MPKLPSEVDVVVCGGGIIGGAICYYLTQKPSLKVLCLEQESKGSGSTQRSAAAFRQQFSSKVNIAFSLYSGRKYETFRQDFHLSQDVFHQNGYLFLYSEEKLWEDALKRLKIQKNNGLSDVVALTDSALTKRFPEVCAQETADFKIYGATFCPTDGFLDPVLVCHAYFEQAVSAGLQFFERTPLQRIEVTNNKISAVYANGQKIKTACVVNASGIWANEVLRSLGIAVPIVPVKRYLYTTNQLERNVRSLPMMVCNLGPYGRPEIGGLLLGWDERPEKPKDYHLFNPTPPPFEPNYEIEEGFGAKNLEGYGYQLLFEMAPYFPFMAEEVALEAATCGYYDVSPDDRAILGEDPRIQGLIHAIGFSGHGVMHAPAVGDQIAQLVQRKTTTIDWKQALALAPLLKNEPRPDPEIMII